jgi:hypothetical protein
MSGARARSEDSNAQTGELIHPAITYVVNPAGKITHLVDGTLEATLLALGESGTR